MAWRIVEHAAVPSTNDLARALAEGGDPGPVAVVAERQTAGRGRRGRAWVSPPGGLYLSALLRPRVPPARAGLLPLAAGVAVAEVIEGLGLAPELRWPNDVLLEGRKLGGILCEARVEAAGLAWVVIGVGLNVGTPADALAAVGGTSLSSALGRTLDPRDLRAPLLAALERWVAAAEGQPAQVVEAWSQRAPMLGRSVSLTLPEGPIAGTARRVEATGALVVATPAGEVVFLDGDVVRVDPGVGRPAGVPRNRLRIDEKVTDA
jgi:BirA family biotin operon repressor/biotin-[acetyl-CoA-carboxylase] ligase